MCVYLWKQMMSPSRNSSNWRETEGERRREEERGGRGDHTELDSCKPGQWWCLDQSSQPCLPWSPVHWKAHTRQCASVCLWTLCACVSPQISSEEHQDGGWQLFSDLETNLLQRNTHRNECLICMYISHSMWLYVCMWVCAVCTVTHETFCLCFPPSAPHIVWFWCLDYSTWRTAAPPLQWTHTVWANVTVETHS